MQFLFAPGKFGGHFRLKFAQAADFGHGANNLLPIGTILGILTDALTPEPELLLNSFFDQIDSTFFVKSGIVGSSPFRLAWYPTPKATASNAEIENPPRNLPLLRSKRLKALSS